MVAKKCKFINIQDNVLDPRPMKLAVHSLLDNSSTDTMVEASNSTHSGSLTANHLWNVHEFTEETLPWIQNRSDLISTPILAKVLQTKHSFSLLHINAVFTMLTLEFEQKCKKNAYTTTTKCYTTQNELTRNFKWRKEESALESKYDNKL